MEESFRAIEGYGGGSFERSKDPISADGLSQRNKFSSQGVTNILGSNTSKEWGQLGLKTYEMQILLS